MTRKLSPFVAQWLKYSSRAKTVAILGSSDLSFGGRETIMICPHRRCRTRRSSNNNDIEDRPRRGGNSLSRGACRFFHSKSRASVPADRRGHRLMNQNMLTWDSAEKSRPGPYIIICHRVNNTRTLRDEVASPFATT